MMKKEVALAIAAGSLLGIFLGFGFWKANRAVKKKADSVFSPTTTPATQTLEEATEPSLAFSVTGPEDHQVFFSEYATVSGTATQNTPVVILTENDEYLLVADSAGRFNQTVELIKGINEITIHHLNNGSGSEQKLSLIYTSEEL